MSATLDSLTIDLFLTKEKEILKDFLLYENLSGLFRFYEGVEEYKKLCAKDSDFKDVKTFAKTLYRQYVRRTSAQAIFLSEDVRLDLEHLINSNDNDNFNASLFSEAQDEVYEQLSGVLFNRLKKYIGERDDLQFKFNSTEILNVDTGILVDFNDHFEEVVDSAINLTLCQALCPSNPFNRVFNHFLLSQKNTINDYMFYMAVDRFHTLTSEKALRMESNMINETFIKQNARKKISLSKESIDSIFEKCGTGQLCADMYDDAFGEVIEKIEMLVMPLFAEAVATDEVIRSQLKKDIFDKKNVGATRRSSADRTRIKALAPPLSLGIMGRSKSVSQMENHDSTCKDVTFKMNESNSMNDSDSVCSIDHDDNLSTTNVDDTIFDDEEILGLTLEELLFDCSKYLRLYNSYLLEEHSDENYMFWRIAQDYKESFPHNCQQQASMIISTFVFARSPKQVNLKETTRAACIQQAKEEPTACMFVTAQQEVFSLMKTDSFKRFKIAIQKGGSLRERLRDEMLRQRRMGAQKHKLKSSLSSETSISLGDEESADGDSNESSNHEEGSSNTVILSNVASNDLDLFLLLDPENLNHQRFVAYMQANGKEYYINFNKAVVSYKKIKDPLQKSRKAESIVDLFLMVGGKNYIPLLDYNSREAVLANLEKMEQECECPDSKAFDPLQQHCHQAMQPYVKKFQNEFCLETTNPKSKEIGIRQSIERKSSKKMKQLPSFVKDSIRERSKEFKERKKKGER